MKIKKSLDPEIKTNSAAKSVNFKIGDEEFIIDTFRNRFYGNPIQTLVQEYICNARDANIDAGSTKNIIIKAPVKDDPTFKVRDFGSGLSEDKIEIFTSYGLSTKRNSTLMTGGFGFGGKSAWAYTDNFTIITYIDKFAYHYLAHIGTKKSGTLEFQGKYKTNEENGTEFIIGVNPNDFFDFHKAICRATFFWNDRPEYVNLLEGGRFQELLNYWDTCQEHHRFGSNRFYYFSSYQYRDSFLISKADSRNGSYQSGVIILVDGIPYPLYSDYNSNPNLQALIDIIHNNTLIVIELTNDEIEITANREKLQDSEFTRKTLNQLFIDLKNEICGHQLDEFSHAKSFKEHINLAIKFNKIFKYPDFVKYRGKFDDYHVDNMNSLSAEKLFSFDFLIGSFNFYRKNLEMVSDSESGTVEDLEFIYEDKEEGKNIVRSKIRCLLNKKVIRKIVLFSFSNNNKENFLKTMEEIGAIKSSSLEQETKTGPVKVKKKTNLQQIYINKIIVKKSIPVSNPIQYLNSFENRSQLFELGSLTNEKFIYAQHKEATVYFGNDFNPTIINDKDLRDLSLYFKDKDFQLCTIAPSFTKRVKNDSHFIKLDDFLEKISINEIKQDELYRLMTFVGRSKFNEIEPILKFIKPQDFKDPIIREGFILLCKIKENIQNIDKSRNLPSMIIERQLKLPNIEKEQKTINDFFDRFNHHYQLTSVFKLLSEDRCQPIISDFVLYFNSRYRETE